MPETVRTIQFIKHIPGVNDREYISMLEAIRTADDILISMQKREIRELSDALFKNKEAASWVPMYKRKDGHLIAKCSCCGFSGDTTGFKYCPNCGKIIPS